MAGEPYASTGVERTAGFRRAYADAGRPVPDDRVLHSRFDVEGGHLAAAALLDLRPRPTAIFAVNDTAAIGVMGALRERGLRPGEDVAVVGYNDIPIAADLPVPLTSVHAPMFEMGSEALDPAARPGAGAAGASRGACGPSFDRPRRRSATTPRHAPTAPEHDPDTFLVPARISSAHRGARQSPHHTREPP